MRAERNGLAEYTDCTYQPNTEHWQRHDIDQQEAIAVYNLRTRAIVWGCLNTALDYLFDPHYDGRKEPSE